MDIQYQVYPPSNSTWFQLPVHGTHSKTLLFCYPVLFVFFFFFWSFLSYTSFSVQAAFPIAYIPKPKTYLYTSICAYIDLFALCTLH